MTKVIMLGTGNGATLNLYNTCFVIQNKQGNFLVDTGGSIEIINRLTKADIKLTEIHHIFISHSHTDHILGLIWLFKVLGVMSLNNELTKEPLNIYCNDVVYNAIKIISECTLPQPIIAAINKITNFIILQDGTKKTINGNEYHFFDILARGTKQFGFECYLDKNRFIFLGDETLNSSLYAKIRNADYVTHEAFCLDKEEPIFQAYRKNHSTALSAAKVMENLGVKNLILYHTEESHPNRRELYIKEAESAFSGHILVPDDLEEIKIKLKQ